MQWCWWFLCRYTQICPHWPSFSSYINLMMSILSQSVNKNINNDNQQQRSEVTTWPEHTFPRVCDLSSLTDSFISSELSYQLYGSFPSRSKDAKLTKVSAAHSLKSHTHRSMKTRLTEVNTFHSDVMWRVGIPHRFNSMCFFRNTSSRRTSRLINRMLRTARAEIAATLGFISSTEHTHTHC